MGARLKEVLLARNRLQKVVEELGLYPKMVKEGRLAEAIEELHQAVTFKINEGDTYVIGATGDSPEEAQQITAKLTDTLIDENQRLRSDQARFAKDFLDAEKKRNEETLHQKELDRANFLQLHPEFAQDQTGAGGAGFRASSKRGADAAAAAAAAAAGGDANLITLRREEDRLKHQIASPTPPPPRPQDPALVAARNEADAKVAAARRDLNDKRARYTEQHPDVRAAATVLREAEAAAARAAEALKAADAVPAELTEINPRVALEQRLSQVQDEIRDYVRKHPKGTAPDEPVETTDSARKIVASETEWARINREVAEARERFEQLDTRQFMATMTASSLNSGQAAMIIVIDPAFLPSRPIGLTETRLIIFGVAGALFLGLGLVVLLGFLDDRVLDRGDVERLELAPVLIEVPLGRPRRV
jgi:capsular polysaccharide biosynthesis protein